MAGLFDNPYCCGLPLLGHFLTDKDYNWSALKGGIPTAETLCNRRTWDKKPLVTIEQLKPDLQNLKRFIKDRQKNGMLEKQGGFLVTLIQSQMYYLAEVLDECDFRVISEPILSKVIKNYIYVLLWTRFPEGELMGKSPLDVKKELEKQKKV